MWVFGDNFGFNTYEKYYHQRSMEKYPYYAKERYDVSGFFNNSINSKDRSVLGRMRNLLTSALSDRPLLPKLIILVPDDDLIRVIKAKSTYLEDTFTRVLRWLMKEYECIVLTHKEFMPVKSKRENVPFFIWIEAPFHTNFNDNERRRMFNNVLQEVAKSFDKVAVLSMKKIWEPEDPNLYLAESSRFTAAGLITYWEAVDRTIQYADTTILRKIAAKEFSRFKRGVSSVSGVTHSRKTKLNSVEIEANGIVISA